MSSSLSFYKELSEKLNTELWNEISIHRILTSIEEQNNWAVASDKIELAPYISSEILKNDNPNINAPYGFGKVSTAGRLYTSVLLEAYRTHLKKNECLATEAFEYDQLFDLPATAPGASDSLKYKGVSAKKIIFAEGVNARNNPFFPKGPFRKGKEHFIPNKGEFLVIKAPQLQLDVLLKGPVYIIPLGDDTYKVGATYKREDATTFITDEAKEILLFKLKKMIHCDFEIIDREVGIRPTTKDRRPLLGSLPTNPNKIFLNGLGTHGIMSAPFLSEILYNHLEHDLELPVEMDINRMV